MFLPSPKQNWSKFSIIYFIFLVEVIRHRYEYQKNTYEIRGLLNINNMTGRSLNWYKVFTCC